MLRNTVFYHFFVVPFLLLCFISKINAQSVDSTPSDSTSTTTQITENTNLKKEVASLNAELASSGSNVKWLLTGFAIVSFMTLFLVFYFSRLRSSMLSYTEPDSSSETSNRNVNHEPEQDISKNNLELLEENAMLRRELLQQKVQAQLRTNKLIEDLRESGLVADAEEHLNTLLESEDEDWDTFITQFANVHEGFMKRLEQTGTNLTSKDFKYCAYVRMEFSPKEIATLLAISHRTVEGIRSRLRKKLNLDSKTDIRKFLAEL